MNRRLTAACLFVLAFAGCTRVEYVTRPVLLPTVSAPVLTPVSAASVACLSDDTYRALVARERAAWDWGAALHAIIDANNARAQP